LYVLTCSSCALSLYICKLVLTVCCCRLSQARPSPPPLSAAGTDRPCSPQIGSFNSGCGDAGADGSPPAPGDRGGSGAADVHGATNTRGDGGAKRHPGHRGAAGADRVGPGRPPRVGYVATVAPPPSTYYVPLVTINGVC